MELVTFVLDVFHSNPEFIDNETPCIEFVDILLLNNMEPKQHKVYLIAVLTDVRVSIDRSCIS